MFSRAKNSAPNAKIITFIYLFYFISFGRIILQKKREREGKGEGVGKRRKKKHFKLYLKRLNIPTKRNLI